MRQRPSRFLFLVPVVAAVGCAHPVKKVGMGLEPKLLLAKACAPGAALKAVTGSVRMSVKSRDASGQFPASVQAGPEHLYLEITNPLGGTEATIQIDGNRYTIDTTKQKHGGVRGGEGSWGGIPLRWATELFLGRIPCPEGDVTKTAKLSVNA